MHALDAARVPQSKVHYDNLQSAVAQVLGLNRARVETDRWIAFASHFGIRDGAGDQSPGEVEADLVVDTLVRGSSPGALDSGTPRRESSTSATHPQKIAMSATLPTKGP